MQKYYAPQRYICGAWTGEPITKYVASEIEIKEKITTFELNTPKKTTYLVNFINSEIKNEDYVFDKTAKIDTIYDSFDKAKLRAQELNLEVLSKHKEHTQNLEL